MRSLSIKGAFAVMAAFVLVLALTQIAFSQAAPAGQAGQRGAATGPAGQAGQAGQQFSTPYGTELLEAPDYKRIYIMDEGGPHSYRIIYMDGRPHPANLEPTNYGHSIGHFEGDTLVVDTIGYNEKFWIDTRGTP